MMMQDVTLSNRTAPAMAAPHLTIWQSQIKTRSCKLALTHDSVIAWGDSSVRNITTNEKHVWAEPRGRQSLFLQLWEDTITSLRVHLRHLPGTVGWLQRWDAHINNMRAFLVWTRVWGGENEKEEWLMLKAVTSLSVMLQQFYYCH